ncbi:MAG: S8 family peptidase [Thermoanaerobaculaceae bacterium]
MTPLSIAIVALAAASSTQVLPSQALEKIAPPVWQAVAQAPEGETEIIVSLGVEPWENAEPFEAKRLTAIAASSESVGQEVATLGGKVLARYIYLPALACRLPNRAIPYLAQHPRVSHIGPNRKVRAFDAEGEALMQVPAVRDLGVTGQGVGIAVLDTGVDYTHSELSPGGTGSGVKTVKLWDAVNDDDDPMDDQGHGTAVASVAAGKTLGVARSAQIVAVKVLNNEGQGDASQILTGLDKVLQSIHQGNPYNIRVVNLSLGGYDNTNWPPGSGACDSLDPDTFAAFSSLRQAGALVVVAAGNGSCTNGVAWPACLSNALAVGAVYDANVGPVSFEKAQCTGPSGCTDLLTAADQIACYSDSGEKLDVWAPGGLTTAARKGGGAVAAHGTSIAAPYVSGVAGLLAQAFPTKSSDDFFNAIRNTGKPITDSRNGITRNRVDALQAYQALQGGAVMYSRFYYVTGIARWPGFPPAYWYSSLAILNANASQANLRLSFLSDNANLHQVTFTLAAGAQATWTDVLGEAFGFSGQAVGAILVESDQPVRVLARTYSQVQVKQENGSLAWGTMGQFIEGVEPSQCLTEAKTGYLANLRSDPPFRTNVEFLNVTNAPVQVEVRFYANNGAQINTITLTVPAFRRVQQAKALPDGYAGAYAKVRVVTPGGKVLGLASVVDGKSTDPTTIPLWIP